MSEIQLPKSQVFNPVYLAQYEPSMELPRFNYSGDGKVVIPDRNHPLTRFLAFYFRLIEGKSDDLIWNAYRETSGQQLVSQGVISDEDGSLRASVEGSIALLGAYRDEVAKTRGYAIQKGWPENKWPIDSLGDLVRRLDEELTRINTPHTSSVLEL